MSRYQAMFTRLHEKKEGAFIPFVMLYDPDREASKKIILTLIEAGADALELGIPFSDPLADGPVIQKAGLRALRSGSKVRDALVLVKEIRELHPTIPIGVLTYANLVNRNTLDWFYSFCADCGVDSVLVADVPLMESKPFCDAALKHGVDPVLIAPINLPLERAQDIAEQGRGYTYVVTRKGVTGANASVNVDHKELFHALKARNAPPLILGFGISDPAHVKAAIASGAAGAISGSKVVSIIEDHLRDPSTMYEELARFVRSMKAATIG